MSAIEPYLITVGGVRAGRIRATSREEAILLFVQGREIPSGLGTIRAYVVRQVGSR